MTTGKADGYAFDFNNDGAMDILINSLGRPVRLLENRPAKPSHWIGLKLKGTRFFIEARDPKAIQIRKNGAPMAYQTPTVEVQ